MAAGPRGITDGEILAIRLTDDLVALSGDKHVAVDFFTKVIRRGARPSSHPDPRQLAARNCGFEKAEHYAPNIGYLKLNALQRNSLLKRLARVGCTPPTFDRMALLFGAVSVPRLNGKVTLISGAARGIRRTPALRIGERYIARIWMVSFSGANMPSARCARRRRDR
jgi:hypothetical protein